MDFNKKIFKKFKKYEIPKKKKTLKEYCSPKSFQLQLPQQFVSQIINPNSDYRGLLVYHQIGSGKTCAAITIAENFKGLRKIMVLTPASLIGNFEDELRGHCGGYLSKKEFEIMSKSSIDSNIYIQLKKKSDEKIKKHYQILSYHKFVNKSKLNQINLKNTLLIIDEIQNMISSEGNFYKILLNEINRAPDDLRVVLLSATPIFDKPVEIGLTLNLLRPKLLFPKNPKFNELFLNSKTDKNGNILYNLRNERKFIEMTRGLISYFKGAPDITFPEVRLKKIKCVMESFQYQSYLASLSNEKNFKNGSFRNTDLLKLPTDFFIGPRLISNIVFPNRKINEEGIISLTKKEIEKLENYSIKIYKMMNKIKKSKRAVFIYSNFKEYGGLKTIIQVLHYYGYKDVKKYGIGKKRYAIWSGDETKDYKDYIKKITNDIKNINGKQLKIILGSPSIKEGVSFKRLEQVHILEPYWNLSRLSQIIGRASRFCSHYDLPKENRFVNVYLYIASSPKGEETIDEYIYYLAKEKQKIIIQFENLMKRNAIDCLLNYHANENQLECI